MEISINTKQAYAEVDTFLDLLDAEKRNEIPQKLRDLFKNEKDKEYIKEIDANVPIKEQNLKQETLSIIALLNLEYWCKDEKEKQRLKNIYAKNEQKYQKELREKYNPEVIFKNRNKIELQEEQLSEETRMIIVQEEKWYQKIFNLIKNLFHRN